MVTFVKAADVILLLASRLSVTDGHEREPHLLQCDTLSPAGLIWVIGLALFAAPFCFIPCCMDR